jgi:hypothetical protein
VRAHPRGVVRARARRRDRLRRLITAPELLDGVERIDIVLTHFHLDHV